MTARGKLTPRGLMASSREATRRQEKQKQAPLHPLAEAQLRLQARENVNDDIGKLIEAAEIRMRSKDRRTRALGEFEHGLLTSLQSFLEKET